MGRIFCILTGYLCGSFLTAELVAQERIGKSAFEIGTGNPGMANLAEQGGVGCAFRVLAGDVGKTLLACLLCRYVCGAELGTLAAAYAGLGCILGHDYPFWHWFHGGKGVACNAAADPHLAYGRPLFLPDWSHGCATHRLSPLRRGPDPRRLHPPGLPGIRPGARLPDSHHDLHHAPPARPRPPEYDFGYGEEGGFAGDAEVRKL